MPSKFLTLDLQMSVNFRLIREILYEWTVTNTGSHNWQSSENSYLWIHRDKLDTCISFVSQDPGIGDQKDCKDHKSGKTVVEQSLLDMTGLTWSYSWGHDIHDCLHKIKPVNIITWSRKRLQIPTRNLDSWLLGEKESVFFKNVVPDLWYLSECPHTLEYMTITNYTHWE